MQLKTIHSKKLTRIILKREIEGWANLSTFEVWQEFTFISLFVSNNVPTVIFTLVRHFINTVSA